MINNIDVERCKNNGKVQSDRSSLSNSFIDNKACRIEPNRL